TYDCMSLHNIITLFFFFFFFQAEDGIRDATVTGVQTCALPISSASRCWWISGPSCLQGPHHSAQKSTSTGWRLDSSITSFTNVRSEERRVGKEWRSRWAAEHDEKKK